MPETYEFAKREADANGFDEIFTEDQLQAQSLALGGMEKILRKCRDDRPNQW